MAEQDKPIVINDRRKFRMDGELREPRPEDAAQPVESAPADTPAPAPVEKPADRTVEKAPIPINSAHTITPVPEPPQDELSGSDAEAIEDGAEAEAAPDLPPPPTAEEIAQVRNAYEQTVERLDTMMRSANLGGERLPPMDFTQLVQSIYMSAMMQLGAGTQQGQQARVDIVGARQSIDMLSVVADKAGSNLNDQEQRLIDAALFELRMGFLEITQLLARQAAAKQAPPPTSGPTGAGGGFGTGGFTGGGPRIVR